MTNKTKGVILLFLYNAEIIINEISIGTPAIPHSPDSHRLDSLYTSLRATKGWLDVWIELEAEEYLQLSCIIFFQFTRSIVSLYRLTVLEDPAWSKKYGPRHRKHPRIPEQKRSYH
jgi:hypothetical protein